VSAVCDNVVQVNVLGADDDGKAEGSSNEAEMKSLLNPVDMHEVEGYFWLLLAAFLLIFILFSC
jgi:hypothetical protein